MNILVIGGSYFLGKAFVKNALCAGHNVTTVNRGTRPLQDMNGRLTCLTSDRHDAGFWQSLQGDYDVFVDFCGYAGGDIRLIFDNVARLPGRYIFVSTVDVYRRQTGDIKDENVDYEDRITPDMGAEASYICGKIALEKELASCCADIDTGYVILRPSIIYGAENYAPREKLFIRYMKEAGILPMVTGASGSFQMVYVEDAAEAVLRCCEYKQESGGECFNICGREITTYDTFFDALKGAYPDVPIKEIHMNVESAISQGAPLPFPVTKEETELYSGEKSERLLGMCYRSLADGLADMR